MQTDITFLHTAQVHVKTFSDLLLKQSTDFNVKHIVNVSLLEDAMKNGITGKLKSDVTRLIKTSAEDSKLVVCTCSTLGEIVEGVELHSGKLAIRIDRAMADLAVQSGTNILVLAALESTLIPTKSLMESSQAGQKTVNNIDYCVIENSWEYFLNGYFDKYLQSIATVIDAKQADYDCIVLAQASMAAATKLITKKRALILSSPSIGVESLVSKLVEQAV